MSLLRRLATANIQLSSTEVAGTIRWLVPAPRSFAVRRESARLPCAALLESPPRRSGPLVLRCAVGGIVGTVTKPLLAGVVLDSLGGAGLFWSRNMDKITLILIGIFLLLFGVFSVTNIEVEWGRPLMGFSALAAGAVCLIRAFK